MLIGFMIVVTKRVKYLLYVAEVESRILLNEVPSSLGILLRIVDCFGKSESQSGVSDFEGKSI